MIGRKKVSIAFSINWLWAIGIAVVVLLALYGLRPDWRAHLAFIAPVLAGGAALVAAFNALEARAEQGAQAKKTVALQFIARWLDPTLFHVKKSGRETILHFRGVSSVDDRASYLKADAAREANMMDVLNIFEAMSTAIQEGLADEQVLRRFFCSMSIEYWHCMHELVAKRRAERANARLYQEFEWLYNRWKV